MSEQTTPEIAKVTKVEHFLQGKQITKVIASDFKKLSLVIKGEKIPHFDKNDKYVENDLVTINPNQLFECDIDGDSEAIQLLQVIKMLAVSREVKKYIMSAFFCDAVIDICQVYGKVGEIDEESGRVYTSDEYSYRLEKVVLKPLNPIMKQLIMSDIQNQSILEPKQKPSINALFGANSNATITL